MSRRLVRTVVLLVAGFGFIPAGRAMKCPNVMFVLDRSGSMVEDPNGRYPTPKGTSKWELLQRAVKKILDTYGSQLPFGMEMFTSSAFSDLMCYTDTRIDVEPAHDTSMRILKLLLAAQPDANTNTGEAIKRALNDPAMLERKRGQYLILITDGDPNCNPLDYQNASFTTKQIALAAAQGIHTFVVGFDGSGGVNPAGLNRMANAGLEPQPDCDGATLPCYYSASNAQAFSDALDKIVRIVTGGEFGPMACDDSCLANGCNPGFLCASDELHPEARCVPDPCRGAVCAPGSFCRMGTCVDACLTPCGAGKVCHDGACVADPCSGQTCVSGQFCDATTGQCAFNPCLTVTCPDGTLCDPQTARCAENPCGRIACPRQTICVAGGNCEAYYGDGGSSLPSASHPHAGCGIARAPSSSPMSEIGLILVAVVGAIGRRFGRRRESKSKRFAIDWRRLTGA